MEKLTISSGSDLINDCGLQIEENTSRNVLTSTCLTEEGVEGIIASSDCFV